MDCNQCEYYNEVIISFLDSSNIETDMGIRNVECLKMKEELIEKQLLTNHKSDKTCIIGIISRFNCPDNLKYLLPNVKDDIKTPNWCPKKGKKS